MGDAAQGEPIRHVVFQKPFKVEPVFEEWETPGSYRRFPGGDKLPDRMKVWRIQQTDKTYGGVVSRSWGFDDSPDAEILTPGYNNGKEHGAVGVGRHGNFLQWGFSAPPSQMTEAGRRFFLNCICYIHRFDGAGPLIRCQRGDRIEPVRLASLVDQIEDVDFRQHMRKSLGEKIFDRYADDAKGLSRHFEDDYEYIYYKDGTYLIDRQLKSLGLSSNRRIDTLESLITRLRTELEEPVVRRLLRRYTAVSFATPDEWQAWFEANRDRIYFSDIGGYKFRVMPEDYPN